MSELMDSNAKEFSLSWPNEDLLGFLMYLSREKDLSAVQLVHINVRKMRSAMSVFGKASAKLSSHKTLSSSECVSVNDVGVSVVS